MNWRWLVVLGLCYSPLVWAGQKTNPFTGKPDYCNTFTDGVVTASGCQSITVTSLTDNGNGTYTLGGGGGGGDVTDVGDCATGACFGGASGTTLTPSAGTLTVVGDLALSGIAGPDIRLTPTGGDTFHLGAEKSNGSLAFFSNVTDGKIYWIVDNAHRLGFPQVVNCPFLSTSSEGWLSCGTTIGSTNGSITGNAATATALAAQGSQCSANSAPRGVDASGNANNCTAYSSSSVASAHFLTSQSEAALSAEVNLGALTTGLMLNTVAATVATPSTYAGTSCTNQFPRSLNASGSASCATVASTDLASSLSLTTPNIGAATGTSLALSGGNLVDSHTSPSLELRDTSDNSAFLIEHDSAESYRGLTIWEGTDTTGSAFAIQGTPFIQLNDSTDRMLLPRLLYQDGGGMLSLTSAGKVQSAPVTYCAGITNLTSSNDNMPLGNKPFAVTIKSVGCSCIGTCTTKADIALENGAGTAMTHSAPVCTTNGTESPVPVTAANSLAAYQELRFDTTNTPSPTTDTYVICAYGTPN